MLEMAVLGLLKEEPLHGYDLRKRLRSDFGLLASLSFGSLYPCLSRLEGAGAIREVVEDDDSPDTAGGTRRRDGRQGSAASRHWRSVVGEAVPLSGSLTGEKAAFRARLAGRAASPRSRPGGSGTRARRVYELTSRGEEMFESFLVEEPARPEDAKSFALRWAFAGHLDSDGRRRLLERRRRQLEESLRLSRRAVDAPARPLNRFERSLAEHSRAAVQLDLDWIDHLVASEMAAEGAQGAGQETGVP